MPNKIKKTLVTYYSRTGITKKVAKEISKTLNCDIDEIVDKKDRSGAYGYMMGGRDALFKNLTDIIFAKKPNEYELIIIGTPVWASTMAPAIRAYIEQNKASLNNVAFFATFGGGGDKKTLADLGALTGKKAIAELSLLTKEVQQDNFKEKLAVFIDKIKA